jgi:dual specificity MAP kinase phosphatase
LLANDSDKNNHRHVPSFSSLSSFENTSHCPYSLYYQRRKSFTYINSVTSTQSIIVPQPSTTATTDMLLCQQKSVIDNNNENEQEDKTNSSIFITSLELSAYMTSVINNPNGKILIIDCGLPLRYNERRIKESFLLNINDRLSRKRLMTRGLKNFLDETQLNRLNQSEIITLYDDSVHSSSCSNSIIPQQISPTIKCIYDEIKRYDSTKTIYILQSSFDEFYQHYPIFCYVSLSNYNQQDNPSPSPTIDIDSYQMSEVIPGLYLGNAHDAEDKNLLKENQIKSIINISTTIPCYYENETLFDYYKLPCNDSCQENILQHFDKTFEYMHKKLCLNENILVHCQGGISRSPSFIIGYLMKYYSKTFDQAYLIVKDKRKIINPNLNFLAQLTRYEQMITTTMA